MTFLDILTDIKDRILTSIAVFDVGYAYCRLDDSKGLVATVGNDANYVGINDTSGDYFYIRIGQATSVSPGRALTDCAVAIMERFPCTLVAVVNEADEFKLSDALINELLKTKVCNIKSRSVDALFIVGSEFKGLGEDMIESAKAKIGERTIVRIDFEIESPLQTNNCEYSICKTC